MTKKNLQNVAKNAKMYAHNDLKVVLNTYKLSSFTVTENGFGQFTGNYYAVLDYLGVSEKRFINLIAESENEEKQFNHLKKKIERKLGMLNHSQQDDLMTQWVNWSNETHADPCESHNKRVYINRDDEDWMPIEMELATLQNSMKLIKREAVERAYCLAALHVCKQEKTLRDLAYDYALNYELLLEVNNDLFQPKEIEEDEFFWNFLNLN
ncbi:hypothetical protein [Lactococcus allomyrinae]|uniref:Uncharacterized protein n=1 Tax=Lactococcus allomyrinae TaxID=2419773 RepID=A0A387BFC2_9LACT|nr:hypothetical protein [Lactococcus allomyrinae]AYF99805.1 hypothetical protein D7I46_01120 [Lactococcus allomyrinae]